MPRRPWRMATEAFGALASTTCKRGESLDVFLRASEKFLQRQRLGASDCRRDLRLG